MTDVSAHERASRGGKPGKDELGPFGRLSLFISQIIDELRKVVRPTGSELLNYTIVVIVFVLVIMAIVAGLDFVFHRLMLLLLAG